MSTDRRDFLKFLLGSSALGIASSPLQTIIEAAIFKSLHAAHASTIAADKFYFAITFPGAPPRWSFDLFLDPYGTSNGNIQLNGGVTNCFDNVNSSAYMEPVYKTVDIAKYGLKAPWMWGQKMPKAGGGFVSISELMEHMVVIQGVNTEAPGHADSTVRMEQANGYTVAGFLSDAVKSPFNGVDLASGYPFISKGGQGVTTAGFGSATTNIVSSLMSKFSSNNLQIYKSLDGDLRQSYQNVLDNLNYDAGVRYPATINIKKTHEGALELINSSIGNLTTIWNEKHSKYKDLVERSFNKSGGGFDGFFNKHVGAPVKSRGLQYQNGSATVRALNPDLRDMAFAGMHNQMSQLFAVAEFLAENKLSSSLLGRVGNMTANMAIAEGGSAGARGVTHDQHNVGNAVSTMTNSLMYRALSSCLYEFINNRKTSGKGYGFDDMVIKLSGEFNRSPRIDGTGSDHGFQAQVSTLFSGLIDAQTPKVVGRIYKDGSDPGLSLVGTNYKGSWGIGAPINIESGPVTLTPGHVHSTVCELLGIRSPANNNVSLLQIVGGKARQSAHANEDIKLKVVG